MRTWEEYIEERKRELGFPWKKTDIQCPECGKAIYVNMMTIDGNIIKPKHKFCCNNCDWEGEA